MSLVSSFRLTSQNGLLKTIHHNYPKMLNMKQVYSIWWKNMDSITCLTIVWSLMLQMMVIEWCSRWKIWSLMPKQVSRVLVSQEVQLLLSLKDISLQRFFKTMLRRDLINWWFLNSEPEDSYKTKLLQRKKTKFIKLFNTINRKFSEVLYIIIST